MTTEEINKRNNAMLAVMGGPKALKESGLLGKMMDEEFSLMGPEDLQYNTSWDWLIPAWSKIRHLLSPMMVISAIMSIDNDEINELWKLLSQVAMDWCKQNNIKYE